ncbi:hypothetical protein AAG570_000082 [Ranatra chinensis]|uniref:Uncharacterized protein n=1 Tax=Ranatra chinensis TaxID=642074 RepID=A0ABD0YW17_9HEMI
MPEHDEVLCHATGERRQHFLNQIKHILDKLDDRPCQPDRPTRTKPLIKYPGYIDKSNPRYLLDPIIPPLIVSASVAEVRPTSEYKQHEHENERYLQYIPVTGVWCFRFNSRELRAGMLYSGCECIKTNGLQDQCPRSDCQGHETCSSSPPSCLPSVTYMPAKGAPPPDLSHLQAQQSDPCCCSPKKPLAHNQLPQNFKCFRCG